MPEAAQRLEREGHVARLTLDRPERANALDMAALASLLEHLRALGRDEDCRVIVIQGAGGRHFCAGADRQETKSHEDAARFRQLVLDLLDEVRATSKLVVCAVTGSAVGLGAMLALSADTLVCRANARFGLPELRLGISPAITWHVVCRQFGESVTMQLLLSGETLPVDQLLRFGLAATVVAPEDYDEALRSCAHRLAELPSAQVAVLKRLRAQAWREAIQGNMP